MPNRAKSRCHDHTAASPVVHSVVFELLPERVIAGELKGGAMTDPHPIYTELVAEQEAADTARSEPTDEHTQQDD